MWRVQAEAPGSRLVGGVPARGQLPRPAAARRRLPAVRRPAAVQRGPHRRRRGKGHEPIDQLARIRHDLPRASTAATRMSRSMNVLSLVSGQWGDLQPQEDPEAVHRQACLHQRQ
jgi:hypothetical protein